MFRDGEVDEVVAALSRGKAVGLDGFPDDTLSRGELKDWLKRYVPYYCAKMPDKPIVVRGLLLSKTKTVRPEPKDTRMIVVLNFIQKVLDKIFFLRLKEKAYGMIP